jgi:2-dehydro-3-deoxyglucarate aldolase/4-hydroxy-2-oxoheptanedioate aldolase
MGHLADTAHASVQEKVRFAAQECKRLGKPCGIVGQNPEAVATYLDFGYSWVAVSSDMGMMVGRAQEYLAKVRAKAG